MLTTDQYKTFGFDEDHPGARFLADHAMQKEVCRSHLALADELPEALSHPTGKRLIQIFRGSWEAHVRLYEDVISPLLLRSCDDAQRCLCATHLPDQHVAIARANEELAQTAAEVASGASTVDGLAYLLRKIAERRNDHIMAERLLVIPALPLALAPFERESYRQWVTQNPWPISGTEIFL